VKDTNLDAHDIRIFKKVIRTNGEIVEVDIIDFFGFTLQDFSKWGKNFVQDHLNYTFNELEQAFWKHF
jgi:hypothetical protein